jgi:hypothetical protein
MLEEDGNLEVYICKKEKLNQHSLGRFSSKKSVINNYCKK